MRSRAIIGVLMAVLALPAAAVAKPGQVIPPSDPSINQYVEVVPTSTGGRPSNSVADSAGQTSQHVTTAGGTASVLAHSGAAGRQAAAVALAGAPAHRHRASRPHHTGGTSGGRTGHAGAAGGSTGGSGPSGGAGAHGSSSLATLAKTLTGSGTPGGTGALLPVALILGTVLLAGVAIGRSSALRRRGSP